MHMHRYKLVQQTVTVLYNAKSVWWFVVHGTEDDLTILERDWDKIHQQTLWSLQSCYMSPSSVLPNTENVSTINVPTINSCSDSPLATTPENENENPPAHGSSFLEEVPTPPTSTTTPQVICESVPSINRKPPLKILFFNVRSLLPKIDNLRILISVFSPDIVCLVETWLDADISDSEIAIQGYSITRLDRNRHGGGVLFYINNLFTYSLVFKGSDSFECIVLSMFCNNRQHSPDLTVALVYRPPNSYPIFFDTLFSTLCNLDVSLFSNFVLLGDFNVNYFCTQNPLFSRLNSVTLSFNLTQLVAEPTRVCDTSCTLIDLIFVSTPTKVDSCNTIPPLSTSDHFGLQLNISTINPRRQRKIHPRLVWRYSLADFESITNMLDDADLEELLDDDVNSSWIKW